MLRGGTDNVYKVSLNYPFSYWHYYRFGASSASASGAVSRISLGERKKKELCDLHGTVRDINKYIISKCAHSPHIYNRVLLVSSVI